MGASSNVAGNSTLSELEDSMDPSHEVAVVAGDLLDNHPTRILLLKALVQQRQIDDPVPQPINHSVQFISGL